MNAVNQIKIKYAGLFSRNCKITIEMGWINLLDFVCDQLNDLQKQYYPHFEIIEVKQRMGRLRIYVSCDDVPYQIGEILRYADTASAELCEICGESAKVRYSKDRTCIKTLCTQHKQLVDANENHVDHAITQDILSK